MPAAIRKRLRIAFWCALLGIPVALKSADALSARHPVEHSGIRVLTSNVNTNPALVAEAIRPLQPDIVFMQETAAPCRDAGRILGLLVNEGSDQCFLSRWPMAGDRVAWPGPWQPPQVVGVTHPSYGRIAFANARLALPHTVAMLSGNAWYTAAQRREQYVALRRLLEKENRALVCGDMNAFPAEVDLGERFHDAWTRFTYGGTFPVWLPAARIDQCWSTSDMETTASWTQAIPSDHRAVVFDVAVTR